LIARAGFPATWQSEEALNDAAPRNLMRANALALPQKGVMNITKNLGMLLLAIYLILAGLMGLLGFSLGILMPILALAAGILILIGK